MLRIIVLLLSLGITVNVLANTTYTTSTGAVFTQAQGPGSFGAAWKDPSGMIWSAYQGDFTNDGQERDGVVIRSPSTETCAKIGGRLPIVGEYKKLMSYFDLDTNGILTKIGLRDLLSIFPDMHDHVFWTASLLSNNLDSAILFKGAGGVTYIGDRANAFSVRCVTP